MYRTQATIASTARFRVISYGNGGCYVMINNAGNMSVCCQGDDATEFRARLDALEDANPTAPLDTILADLWGQFECVAQQERVA